MAVHEGSGFVSRVLTTIGLVVLAGLTVYFFGLLVEVLLVIFAAVLLAVAITGVRCIIHDRTPLSERWSLVATYLLIVVLMAGAGAVIWPQLSEQIPKFIEKVPEAFEQLSEMAGRMPWVEGAIESVGDTDGGSGGNNNGDSGFNIPSHLLGVFSTTLGTITNLSLIVLIAIYFTLSPKAYVQNLLILVPRAQRKRAEEVMQAQTKSLRFWLLGRLVSMVFVGVLAGIGLMLLGVPMAFTLGLIAGVATFIPYIGPILGAIPALMVALLQGPMFVLYVAILYLVVETAESSLIAPLANKKAVHIAPAYTVIIQLAGGVIAGIPGVIVATPLAVVVAVTIQLLYVEDVLGEDVEILGS
ncbi:Predicted PurR-regulated permease PerM [Geoalkalibacter ferrihydriticus]|uniref:Predicted PurR-regulated permease PerM n=1 Tax=Geoalkalibacter ferrihydriticus TaxID=392333 RepID=A0A1G9RD07_9BACT|nr:AI-2E family transporter [Geoalkalibacter ferrihydriticus]SDM20747.1 Predicted PurR-regulated permease PerM [Geoalkalibacter ferrihydriticus]